MKEQIKERPFHADGIRFECQGSGKCCVARGTYGYVYVNALDRKRLAEHFKISVVDFIANYCETTDGWLHLKGFDKACAFLKNKQCTVYEARPNQCRAWPFWPENMNAKTWNKDISAYCPGVGKGRLFTQKEIDKILALDPIDPKK